MNGWVAVGLAVVAVSVAYDAHREWHDWRKRHRKGG